MDALDGDRLAAAERLINQGNDKEDSGALDAAVEHYEYAVRLAPTLPRAHLNLGNGLRRLGRKQDALIAYNTALRLDASYASAHSNLGTLLATLGAYEAAATALREAIRLRPDVATAYVALANVLELAGDWVGAEDSLHKGLLVEPSLAGAAHNLGALLAKQGRWDESRSAFEKATAIAPEYAEPYIGLANLYIKLGRPSEAEGPLRRALLLKPTFWEAYSVLLFSLNLRQDFDARQIYAEHRQFGRAVATSIPKSASTNSIIADPNRRLRIGYVSGDLGRHPVALFLRPVVEIHDKVDFEIYCYSNNETDDEVTLLLKTRVEHWRDVAGIEDAVVGSMIKSDAIDILVDLSGHTGRSRITVFAGKPAPIQVSWLGYLCTTGLETIDYRISDKFSDPPGTTEQFHTERLFRMRDSQYCYLPMHDVPIETRSRSVDPEQVVFGSFNQYAKISDSCLDLWCAVLRQLPKALLRVHDSPSGTPLDGFKSRVAERGVDVSRVSTVGRLGIVQYLSAISEVDIALDSFPYSGGTTTLDTLWMGVPVVALPGERSISRTCAGILTALGLSEFVARDRGEYIGLNVRLAEDRVRRQALRGSLRALMQASPLMDAPRFVHGLEAGYRQMWQEWCHSRATAV